MVRDLQLARRRPQSEAVPTAAHEPWDSGPATGMQSLSSCAHRTVAKDGKIICSRVVEGDNEVSPNVCRDCPFKAVNCTHLRFSLRQTSPSPLVVRYNGRVEIWDDGPCELSFERAACGVKVMPIFEPRSCAGCTLHEPVQAPCKAPSRRRKASALGKVVAFPSREPLAVAG
jgi:hypothetical protein